MQDPAAALQQIMKPEFTDQHEQLKCPRCDSTNTKFCYYNNYNLSQPRHFCKNCRRYWTKGGTLRNIPVGGGTRKNSKRKAHPNPNPDSEPEPEPAPPPARIKTSAESSPSWASDPSRIFMGGEDRKVVDVGGSFSSLLAANGSLGNLLEPDGSGLKRMEMGGLGGETESGQDPDGLESSKNGSTCWSGTSNDGWPHLAIYTPGSSFQ